MRYLLLLFILSYSCKEAAKKPLDCARFRQGTFAIEDDNHPYRITRTGDRQVEKNLLTGISRNLRVVWENDCQYSLHYIGNSDQEFDADRSITNVKIIETGPDYYLCAVSDEEGNDKGITKMRKLK